MPRCAACRGFLIWGGKRLGNARYCNERCYQAGAPLEAARELPDDVVIPLVQELYLGDCPLCGGAGPVDVHASHTIWSALIVTSYRSHELVGCRRCGARAQRHAIFRAAIFGWWGFPYGVFVTPVQIARNLMGLIRGPGKKDVPSKKLRKVVLFDLGSQLLEAASRRHAEAEMEQASAKPP